MRLTLRTLLAHLDRTLEADDDATIAAKLRESDFASQLARRITASISNNQLGAPSPVSTSTADDPNRIAEYLDSVLSAEQVAEIERICLESEQHLAEVAACHQILTLVLGHRAEIPATLRSRIYAIGEQTNVSHGQANTSNGTMDGSVPLASCLEQAADNSAAITRAIAADVGPTASPAGLSIEVEPVGPDDSGVSDAPTRLREVAYANAQAIAQRNEPVMAGSRPLNAAEASELFGRPSRYVPWLVTLGLLAAFLFVAAQAFAPLLRKKPDGEGPPLARGNDPLRVETAEPEDTAEPQDAVAPASTLEPVDTDEPADSVELVEPMEPVATVEAAESVAVADRLPPTLPVDVDAVDTSPMVELNPTPAVPAIVGTIPSPQPSQPMAAVQELPIPSDPASPDSTEIPSSPSVVESPPPASKMKNVEVIEPIDLPGTTLISNESLLLLRQGEDYVLAKKGESLSNGCEVICPPLFRDRLLLLNRLETTFVGPAKAVLESTNGEDLLMTPLLGRFVISRKAVALPSPESEDLQNVAPESSAAVIMLAYGGAEHELTLLDPLASAAVQVVSTRKLGSDPEDESSITSSLEVIALEGTLSWKTGLEGAIVIKAGELLRRSTAGESTKVTLDGGLNWVATPLVASGSLDASARDGLLTLVRGDEPIDRSLREAINFRRAEVGALAARTLVLLDRPTVYFGSGGVLSDVKQKAFWQQHFEMLVDAIDRGPESAANIREAINQMDAAEATAIYRLLWLFSNEQLEAGSDELLVTSLDNSNMTVRVLAAENLRKITGTTLFYKPELETAPRRSSDIKKWEARLRKGEIRWPSQ
jgi:hypothetical protein